MGGGEELYVVADEHGGADADRADVQEDAAKVEEGAVTDIGVHAVVEACTGADVRVLAQMAEVFTVDVHCLCLLAACVVFFGEDGCSVDALSLRGAFGVGHVGGAGDHAVEDVAVGALRGVH